MSFVAIGLCTLSGRDRSVTFLLLPHGCHRHPVRNHYHRTLGIVVQRPYLFQWHHHRCNLDRSSCAPHVHTTTPLLGARPCHGVRFTPESGHVRCTSSCLLWTNSGHTAVHSINSSARVSSCLGTVSPSAFAILASFQRRITKIVSSRHQSLGTSKLQRGILWEHTQTQHTLSLKLCPWNSAPPVGSCFRRTAAKGPQAACPVYPRKRTCAAQTVMSALGQKRTSGAGCATSSAAALFPVISVVLVGRTLHCPWWDDRWSHR